MAASDFRPTTDEALALRIVECIALADERGLAVTSAHLVTALGTLSEHSRSVVARYADPKRLN